MNDFILSLMLMGALSTGESLPFWMTSNQYGLMPEHNGALALVQARTQYDTSRDLQWRWGASFAAQYDSGPVAPKGTADFGLMVDELYGSIKWKVFSLDLGMKHDELDFLGADSRLGSLSTTGGHIIASGNARTLPGYWINLDPVPLPLTKKHVWFYANYGDFLTYDNRYVKGTLVHRTKFAFRFDFLQRFSFHLGLDHYCLWGGDNPDVGEMPITLGNYFRVVTGSHASSDGTKSDQLNVIGDQGGGEFLRLDYRGDGWKATLLHDIPYADGSGMGFDNFPDGVNTLWFGFDDKNRWVTDVVYEFAYTRNQSGWYHDRPTTEEERKHLDPSDPYHYWHHIRGGGDDYFNNSYYKSGWTHFDRPIGYPLFVPRGTHDGTWTSHRSADDRSTYNRGIENNRLRAHHVAVSGMLFKQFPYKLMLTYSQNYGLYYAPYLGESPWEKYPGTVEEFPLHQVSGAFTGEIPAQAFADRGWLKPTSWLCPFSLTLGLYADKGQLLPDLFGFTIGLRYDFRLK